MDWNEVMSAYRDGRATREDLIRFLGDEAFELVHDALHGEDPAAKRWAAGQALTLAMETAAVTRRSPVEIARELRHAVNRLDRMNPDRSRADSGQANGHERGEKADMAEKDA